MIEELPRPSEEWDWREHGAFFDWMEQSEKLGFVEVALDLPAVARRTWTTLKYFVKAFRILDDENVKLKETIAAAEAALRRIVDEDDTKLSLAALIESVELDLNSEHERALMAEKKVMERDEEAFMRCR